MTNNNNVNLGGWRAALIALVLGLLMFWGLSSIYNNNKQGQRHHAERELQIISQMQWQSVLAWRERRLTDADVLSDDALFGQSVAAWLRAYGDGESTRTAAPSSDSRAHEIDYANEVMQEEHQALLQDELRVLLEHKNYSAVYLTDTSGRIRLASDGAVDRSLPKAEAQALRTAFAEARPVAIEPRSDEVFAFPFFSMLAPIYDGVQAVGAVWLVMDVRASLYPLLERWPSGSATAESAIVMRDGDDVLVLSPFRHHPNAALPFRIPLAQTSDPTVQTVLGMRGVFYSQDYRGESVVAVGNIVPRSPWFLLSKVDTREAFAQDWRELLVLGLPIVFGLLFVGTILVYLQRRAWRRERALKLRLERTLHWLENAQKTAAVGYFAYNLDTRVFSISPTSRQIFGFLADKPMTLERWLNTVHPFHHKQVLHAYRRAVNQHAPLRLQYRVQRENDGQERWVEIWGEYETDVHDKRSIRLIGTLQDITERKYIEKELEKVRSALETQVRIDSLTQIANRLALDERLVAEWSRAARHQEPLSLLMIDVDHFKHFNDRYGHVAGDQCLRRVARVISSVVMRSQDLVARYGGEEFVVLLPETDKASAQDLAERICAAMRAEAIPHAYMQSSDKVTVSIGLVCAYPSPGEPVDSGVRALLERADGALYEAKDAGRDRIAAYDGDAHGDDDSTLSSDAPVGEDMDVPVA